MYQAVSAQAIAVRASCRFWSICEVPRTRPSVSTSSVVVRRSTWLMPSWNAALLSKNGVLRHSMPNRPALETSMEEIHAFWLTLKSIRSAEIAAMAEGLQLCAGWAAPPVVAPDGEATGSPAPAVPRASTSAAG